MDERPELNESLDERQVLTLMIEKLVGKLSCYEKENAQIIAYRIAEIVLFSKNIYTEALPRFIKPEDATEDEVFEKLNEMRMNFLNLKDCLEDFEDSMINLMK